VVVKPFVQLLSSDASRPFGVASREQLVEVLAQFRDVLSQLVTVRDRDDVRDVLKTIVTEASLEVDGLSLNPSNGLVVVRHKTQSHSFKEMLYAYLVLAIQEIPFACFRRCAGCSKFFFDGSKRRRQYCSPRCRNRVLVRRYRERNPDRYREYQRGLMWRRQDREGRKEQADRLPH
jgi:hypothetical protein